MSHQIIDVGGTNVLRHTSTDGPLLGRLRGVTARHEIRQFVVASEPISFRPVDAHFVFRGAVPSPLPDLLTTAERQLVVSAPLAAALQRLDPQVTLVPVRLVDTAGATVDGDYAIAVVKTVVSGLIDDTSPMSDGYFYNEVRLKPEPPQALPPLFRLQYSLAIGCNAEAAAVLRTFSGVPLTPFADAVEAVFPRADASWLLWRCGNEGAAFAVDDNAHEDAFEQNLPLPPSTAGHVGKMKPPKSQKKLVDVMESAGAPIVSAKARALLETFGLVDVDFLPVALQDHSGAPCKGEFFVLNVRCERPYIDVAESDIEAKHGLLWTAREIVVDDSAMPDRPPLFRVPGARYPWVFIRRDVAEAIEAAKLKGSRTVHPEQYSYSVEGGSIVKVC